MRKRLSISALLATAAFLACVTTDASSWDAQLRKAIDHAHAAEIDEAEAKLQWALRTAEQDLKDERRAAIASYYLGDLHHTYHQQFEDNEQTARLLERALAHWEREVGKDGLPLAAILTRLGENAHERKDLAAAERYFARADAIVEASLPPSHALRRARAQNARRPEYALHPEELQLMSR